VGTNYITPRSGNFIKTDLLSFGDTSIYSSSLLPR
jgi:hypothetical protein